MRKVINSYTYSFAGEPVRIAVNDPPPPREPEKEAEDEISEEEKKAAAEAEKAEAERLRIEAMAEERVNEIFNAHREAVNNECQSLLQKAEQEAKDISAKAAAAAAEVLSNARREGEAIKENCRREGFDAGFAAGKKDAEEKCSGYLDAVGRFLEEINSKKEAYYISNEEELRETVITAVEKIVLEKIKKNDKVIERIISQAAKNFRNSDFVKISVLEGSVSKQFRTDKEYVSSIAENIPNVEIELLPADEYPEGTIILDNGSEIIDASVPTQLEFLQEIVNGGGSVSDGDE